MNVEAPPDQHRSNRRDFLVQSTIIIGSLGVALTACDANMIRANPDTTASGSDGFTLPPLGYAYNALEPTIDAMTMELHYSKHHAAYVENLNKALKDHPFYNLPIEEVLRRIQELPENIRTTVRNNGGGHANHTMFWEIMKPGGSQEPTGVLANNIKNDFGSFDAFRATFQEAGAKIFGSGWVWLLLIDGKLRVTTTPNQDSPLLEGYIPIMGNDVWEHAYYLKYNNRRPEYLQNWWNVVNWDEVARRYDRTRTTS